MNSTIFSLMIGLAVISVVPVSAQSRGRERGGERERSDNRGKNDNKDRDNKDREHYADRGNRDQRDNHNWKDDRDHGNRNNNGRSNNAYHDHDRRAVRYVHVHDRYCHRQPVIVHRHYSRPRYVYYRDYDVYYDYSRNVYFSYSGRNWSMSTGIPIGMRQVNLRSVKRYEVDYYDDDFSSYLDNGRPAYGKECDW